VKTTMVTFNVLMTAVTSKTPTDRLCENFSAFVVNSNKVSKTDNSDIVENEQVKEKLGEKNHSTYEVSDVRKSHRKSKRTPFYSTAHLSPGAQVRLSGGEAPASRRALDFSGIPPKYSIPMIQPEQNSSSNIQPSAASGSSNRKDVQPNDDMDIHIVHKCEVCGVGSSSKLKMQRHRRLHRNYEKPKLQFKCNLCSKTFNHFAKFIIHKYNHPKSLKSNDLCNLCKARFENISLHHVEVHINSTTNIKGEEVKI